MNTFMKIFGLTLGLCSPLAMAANETLPSSTPGGESVETVDERWEGVIDYLRIPQGEIVVGDKMFMFSTNTTITKRGQKAPLPIGDLKVGTRVRVTPLLPIPEIATPRAIQIEILP